ncbi:MAG TPA: N-acetylmuramidase domain-containing protein [Gammaproteobacteria bacterium]|nr:N-acetylmuramidase domain-containing protein [Gammaproteobacteria bacterium]
MSFGEISKEQWKTLADSLDVEAAALQAVAEVESSGAGFLPDSIKPKVLFEGHVFHRLTGGTFDAEYPNLSYPKWDRKKYSGSLAGEWERLTAACQLDRSAALQSASWGMFQIMGFNYVYCRCADVEEFVALQYDGIDEQVQCFARFVARPPFLSALRSRHWDEFAAAYNGPSYAKNDYAGKLEAAYEAAKAGQLARRAQQKRRAEAPLPLPPGRERFVAVTSPKRKTPSRRRNVRPDPVDLRDWEYRPAISQAPKPELVPEHFCPVKDQGETNACTGFALAAVIEYLLRAAKRPGDKSISGAMLYSMARRYDEWSNDDEKKDTGSSLRGALKGWSKHGACREKLWEDGKEMPRPKKPGEKGEDWWLDAVRRPMGAYYRIAPQNVRDIHVALNEVGVVYASALTHKGWDDLLRDTASRPPKSSGELPEIAEGKGADDQGHAFAIVGYTPAGFIVQNSWGPGWGRGGFAVLPYSDWLRNAMDCWVVQLGVVTVEHEVVAKAETIRVAGKGRAARAVISANETLGNHEISPFVIDMENEGKLSQRGLFRTKDEDLAALLTTHLKLARDRWELRDGEPVDVAIYAHGGLVGEEAAAKSARTWVPHLYTNRIFPIYLMWETGAVDTLRDLFQDLVKGEAELAAAGGRFERFKERFEEWKDQRLEGLARFPGGKMWTEMKQNAQALSGHGDAGVVKLFKLFKKPEIRRVAGPVRLHLIGHSAGSIVHTYLARRAHDHKLNVASLSLLAPAVRLDDFLKLLRPLGVAAGKVPTLIAHLTDAAERSDDTCKPYGHSLLYLVSRSFEEEEETPLLGMERHLIPALATSLWNADTRQLPCPGGHWDPRSAATRATTHGGVDDDPAVQEAVVSFIESTRAPAAGVAPAQPPFAIAARTTRVSRRT